MITGDHVFIFFFYILLKKNNFFKKNVINFKIKEAFSTIININLVCASLFGYNKNELIGKKVTSLMPNIYAIFHDSFIENYLSSNESKFLSKDRILFALHHSNYIFPVYLNVKVLIL